MSGPDGVRPAVIAHTEVVTFSPIPVEHYDRSTWAVRVEFALGFDGPRWAVRNSGRALNVRTLQFEQEPIPSSRTDEWLADHRYADYGQAVAAAMKVCAGVTWNGKTAASIAASPPDDRRPSTPPPVVMSAPIGQPPPSRTARDFPR